MTTQEAPGSPETPLVQTFVTFDGVAFQAWRRDGQRPILDLEAARFNPHLAIDLQRNSLPADFVDRYGPPHG